MTGLGCATFEDAGTAIGLVRNLLLDDAPPGSITGWNPRRDSEGYLRLKFSNRYLSTADDYNDEVEEVTGADVAVVDPKGILATFAMHGKYRKDNEVLYFERTKAADGRYAG